RLTILQHAQQVTDQVLGNQLLFVGQDALNNQLFKQAQVGPVEQAGVVTHSRQQALFGRKRDDVLLMDAQVVGSVGSHTVDGFLRVLFTLQIIPQHINFVQYRKAAGPVVGVLGVDM